MNNFTNHWTNWNITYILYEVSSFDQMDTEFNVKFIYSEKATKILRNLHLFLTGTSVNQKKVEISQNFCGLLRIYEL